MVPGERCDAQGSLTAVGTGVSPSGGGRGTHQALGSGRGRGPQADETAYGGATNVGREGRGPLPTAWGMQGLGSDVTPGARAAAVGQPPLLERPVPER